MTSCIKVIIYDHCQKLNILNEEQKGCVKECFGCKEQLIIDTVIMEQARKYNKNSYTAFIDAASENSLPARKTKPSALKAIPAMVRMCSPKNSLESKMTPRSLIDSHLVRMEPLILQSNRRGLVFLVNVTMLHLRWLRTRLFNLHLLEISSMQL
jgi:hypothetical protein